MSTEDWRRWLTEKERGLEYAHLAGPWADEQARIRAVLRSLAASRALVASVREQAHYGFTDETLENMTEGMSARQMNQWWRARILALTEEDMLEGMEEK